MKKNLRRGLSLSLGICLLLLTVSGCAQTKAHRYQATFLELFDTVTTIVGYSDSEEHFKEFAGQVRDEIREYHELYDIYNDYEGVHNIKTINDNAGLAPVTVDARIIGLLKFAKEEYAVTDGAVNVAFGAVLRIWHDYREAGFDEPGSAELPPMDRLTEAAQHTDIHNVVIDEAESAVYLEDPAMSLDVGAVAKGYAVEQVARDLESQGVTSLLISVGGNVRAIGEKLVPDSSGEKQWNIGIQNPDASSPDTDLMNVLIDGFSIVSSGTYERFYTVNGVQYHHIIDPKTLMPSAYYSQVTILCRDSGLGDALSTALFNMPLAEGKKLVEGLPGVEVAWVMREGVIEFSSGFHDFINSGDE